MVNLDCTCDACSCFQSRAGCEVNIKPQESVGFTEIRNAKSYGDAFLKIAGSVNPWSILSQCGEPDGFFNYAMWNDAKYIENMNAVLQTVYGTKCDTLTKELAVDLLNSAAYIRTTTFNAGLYYWPWLKNYYGENACGEFWNAPIFARVWVDETLEAEMGYQLVMTVFVEIRLQY